jgi:hypothetical protein
MGMKENKWMLAGEKLIREEFMVGINEAEDAPFYTPEEFERLFSKWKKENGIVKAVISGLR